MYSTQRKGLRSAAASSSSATASTSQQSQNFPSTSSASVNSSQISSQLNQIQIADDGTSENDEGEEYGDMHRLVLQGVMAAGYLDAKGVKKLFQESCKQLNCKVPAAEHMAPTFIQKVVREINERIKVYEMMIRSATCEVSGEKFYVFLVTIEKPVMKLQTYFTKVELDLFQKILDSMLRKHRHFAIPMAECINIGGDLDPRTFSKTNAEDFVERMIALQYFTKVYSSKDDFEITLGFRTIREFELIFRETYQDVFANCCLCKMILLNGLKCPKCPAVIHRACLKKYIKNCKMCVTCKGQWKSEEALITRMREDDSELTPSPGTTQGKQTRSSNTGGEVDMPILEPMVSPRSTGSKQNQNQTSPNQKRKVSGTPSSSKTATPTKRTRRGARNRIPSDSDD